MKPLKWFVSIALAFFLTGAAFAQIGVLPKQDTTLREVTDTKFKPGDVWQYATRPGEEQSTLTILRVENSPELGIIVHISVARIRLTNCHGGPFPDSIPHMPFARKALDDSVTKKVASDQPLADYYAGYEEWKAAYSKKSAGIYVVGVSAAVAVTEKTYRSGIGCD